MLSPRTIKIDTSASFERSPDPRYSVVLSAIKRRREVRMAPLSFFFLAPSFPSFSLSAFFPSPISKPRTASRRRRLIRSHSRVGLSPPWLPRKRDCAYCDRQASLIDATFSMYVPKMSFSTLSGHMQGQSRLSPAAAYSQRSPSTDMT